MAKVTTKDLKNEWIPTNPGDHDPKRIMQGKVIVEFFPDGFIALNKELSSGYHSSLIPLLEGTPVDEIDEKIAKIAVYCGVILDGIYTVQERSILCSTLAGRLELLRDPVKMEVVRDGTFSKEDAEDNFDKFILKGPNNGTST